MKKVLVVGGCGALGKNLLSQFRKSFSRQEWLTASLDLSKSSDADVSLVLDRSLSWKDQLQKIENEIEIQKDLAGYGNGLDAVIHVAGGFVAGGLKDGLDHVEKNWEMNAKSAYTSASIASKYLKSNGLLTLTGANSAFDQGPSFAIGYGMSKAATHSLAMSIRANPALLPSGSRVICILPDTIDTPANREAMPDADFSTWTCPTDISSRIIEWCDRRETLPKDLFVMV
mmetsp:Transcript_5848/g.7373  ORF Transcript_5848/g.7373 Transcript_5848/m.7373 type:complete len:229 (-) Transcript_5848:64-750(-)|eukprot:CAMPEP_0204893416 /NCGR_PEP_ID=MMETSP1349-20130617/31451_1 /ASSEMBLY_ACC=CAM_ASM_000710 /TAXON_ID=215587 /ORGANISM="Aplanochytrium stocchinoi, Strain GSBS06" /LENGTH=228 /DNA_ID=CAMNT_0052059997 /DNA_START=33 /DNA_END=719 /DNA_ORIENTATION=+